MSVSKTKNFGVKIEGGGGGGRTPPLDPPLGLGVVFEETTGVYERMDHKAMLNLPAD